MEWSELKHKTMALLLPVYGERESTNIIRILKEDVLSDKTILNVNHITQWNESIKRLLNHEPLAYITGTAWFLNLKLSVRPGVLIPRPETEELADLVLKYMNGKPALKVLDLGTGSGCIALSIKSKFPATEVHALDVSTDALKIAEHNAVHLQLPIIFHHLDILNIEASRALPFKFDILVSNPPYIKSSEKDLMSTSTLAYEPEIALFAGETGLDFYYRIASFGLDYLNSDGRIFVEINESSGLKTMDIFLEFGYQGLHLIKDLSGKDRFITCIKK